MGLFDNEKRGFKGNVVDSHEQSIKDKGALAVAEANQRDNPPMDQQQQGGSNPFDMMRYQQFARTPDQPVSMGNNMAESLLSDDTVPEAIRDKYWFVFHRDNTLTFLDKDRKISKMLNFDIMKIDMLNTMPYYSYDFGKEHDINIVRNVFETKLDRSLGTNENIKNERTTLQSQFSEVKNISEMSQGEVTSTGFFKKLLGRK
jgi:hypothetical protein